MAFKEFVVFLLVCFFGLGSATYCGTDSTTCGLAEICCSDYICRETCDERNGDCVHSCAFGPIAGAVVGTVIFIAITFAIASCFCCPFCPYYRNRTPGQPRYQQFVSTSDDLTQQGLVQYPPPGNLNQPPPPGYSQAPPAYPPQPAQYPPPQAQGQVPPMQPQNLSSTDL